MGGVELHISPVVVAELRRQEAGLIQGTKNDLHASVAKRFKSKAAEGKHLSDSFDVLVDRMEEEFNAELDKVIARTGVSVDSHPSSTIEELVRRDLERRRPFQEKGDEKHRYSTGMRDTLIWAGLLEKAEESSPGDTVVFVTQDGGFLSDDNTKTLHEDLLADLDDRRIPHDKIWYAPNLFLANTFVSERKTDEEKAKAIEAATLALVALEGDSIGWRMGHGGDYGPDDYSGVELPSELEEARIVAVDQAAEAVAELNEDGTYHVTIPATIYIEGSMYITDWYNHEDDNEFELWEHLNERYVSVTTSRRVLFDSHVITTDGVLSVRSFDLVLPPAGDSAGG